MQIRDRLDHDADLLEGEDCLSYGSYFFGDFYISLELYSWTDGKEKLFLKF